MGTLVAHLSDLHVVASRVNGDGGPVGGAEHLAIAVRAIEAMSVRPDVVVLTGDLVDHGEPAEYEVLRDLLSPLSMPVVLVAGNHDRAEVLWSVFGAPHGGCEVGGRLHQDVRAGDVRIIGLDSSGPAREDGVFTEADAGWLDQALASDPTPTVLLIHHPPFATGIWWMDAIGLEGADRLESVVRRHPHVGRVLSGHVHRHISSQWGSTGLYVAPPQISLTKLDLETFHPPSITSEANLILLHHWTGRAWVTHAQECDVRTVTGLAEIVPGWEEFEARLRQAHAQGAPL